MITKEQKSEVIKQFARSANDTGSPEVQIGVLTERIRQISEHLKKFSKDKHSRRGLVMLVWDRRSLLSYLKKRNNDSYQKVNKAINRKNK